MTIYTNLLNHMTIVPARLITDVRIPASAYLMSLPIVNSQNDGFPKVAHKLINRPWISHDYFFAECLIHSRKRTRYLQPPHLLFKSNLERFEASDLPNLVPSRHRQEERALRNPMMVSQPLNQSIPSLFLKMAYVQRSSQYARSMLPEVQIPLYLRPIPLHSLGKKRMSKVLSAGPRLWVGPSLP